MGAQTSSETIKSAPAVSPPPNAQHFAAQGSAEQCPHMQQQKTSETKVNYPSECPMSSAEAGAKNSDINPLNMMPPPNQMPSPDQPFPLSTARVTSSIPKVSDKEENWVKRD